MMRFERKTTPAGLAYMYVHGSGAIVQAEAEAYTARLGAGSDAHALPVLINAVADDIDVQPEARQLFASKELAKRPAYTLVVLKNAPLRVLVNFLTRLSGAAAKTKLFATDAEAITWLDAHPTFSKEG